MAFLVWIEIVHRGLDTALVRRLSGNDDRIPALNPRKTGRSVHPVGFHKDLLTRHGFHADGLEIKLRHIGFAPVVLSGRGDDDSFAPSVGDAGLLAAGHLYHKFIGSGLVLDPADDNQLRGDDNL